MKIKNLGGDADDDVTLFRPPLALRTVAPRSLPVLGGATFDQGRTVEVHLETLQVAYREKIHLAMRGGDERQEVPFPLFRRSPRRRLVKAGA